MTFYDILTLNVSDLFIPLNVYVYQFSPVLHLFIKYFNQDLVCCVCVCIAIRPKIYCLCIKYTKLWHCV